MALDTIFNHPNVGPFICRQLIQRLVTSNPSPAYVARVAAVFNNNGTGVRGDLKAVRRRAILLDTEARSASAPPARLRQAARADAALRRLGARLRRRLAQRRLGDRRPSDPATRLGQSPLRSPSVFNFFRPGYVPPQQRASPTARWSRPSSRSPTSRRSSAT